MARLTLRTLAVAVCAIIALLILLSNMQNYNVKRSKFRKVPYSRMAKKDDLEETEAKVIEVAKEPSSDHEPIPNWDKIERRMINNMEMADMKDRMKLSQDVLDNLPDPKEIGTS